MQKRFSSFTILAFGLLFGACSDNTATPPPPCGAEQIRLSNAGCVDAARSEIARGCNPLSGGGPCMFPWPSNVFTAKDAARPTGLRLAYDDTVVPRNSADEPFPVADYNNRFDGFSPNSQIRFLFPSGVDKKNLPPIDDVAASIAADSPTVLLNAKTGERWLHFSEVDARATDPNRTPVFVRPMKRMDFGTRYVVAVRDLVDPSGKPIEPSPVFRALRDKLPTDLPEVEVLRDAYETMFVDLEKAGVKRETLQLAWDFTTVSNETITRDARAIVPEMQKRAELGNLGFTLKDVQMDPPDFPNLKFVIKGTFKVPSFLGGNSGPGTTFARDANGLPTYQGLADADMYIAIPRKVWDNGMPAPTYLWGHGLLSLGEEVFHIADVAEEFIGVGIDFWGLSEPDLEVLGGTMFPHNLKDGHSVPERLLQSALNFSTMGYLVQGDLSKAPELAKNGQSLVDTKDVYYLGGSQGGIIGGTVMALAPKITRGGLIVGGGTYSLMVWRNTSWPEIEGIWNIFHRDAVERDLLFAMFQSQFDLAEPAIYADHLWREPFAGLPAKRILLVESYGDSQVTNISTEMMARTYGLSMSAPPLYDVYGVPNETAPIDGSALLQVDSKHTMPMPPKENLSPDDDNGAHGSAADGLKVQQMLKDFVLTGKVVHHCEGPCDPD